MTDLNQHLDDDEKRTMALALSLYLTVYDETELTDAPPREVAERLLANVTDGRSTPTTANTINGPVTGVAVQIAGDHHGHLKL